MTIEEFERAMLAAAAALETRMHEAIARGAMMVERQVKREIRHYNPALRPLPRWPKLKPRTLAKKATPGYSPPNNPLLRTGEMRAGIRHSVSGPGETIEARVGVNGVVAVVQERGGGHVPARSYLERAARRKEEAVVTEVRRQLARALKLP